MLEVPVCFDLETLARARIAPDAEEMPEVVRAWAALVAKNCLGDTPPAPAVADRDQGLRQLAVLLGARARA